MDTKKELYLVYDENNGTYRYESMDFIKELKCESYITYTGEPCWVIPYNISNRYIIDEFLEQELLDNDF